MSRLTPFRNCPTYNEALKRRGSLTIWLGPEVAWEATPTEMSGSQPSNNNAEINGRLALKVLVAEHRMGA